MKPQLILITLLSVILLSTSQASIVSTPEPFIITSPNGQATLKYIPNPKAYRSLTVAHRLTPKGKLKEVWRASGLNLGKRSTHISNCGRYLAVRGSANFTADFDVQKKTNSETLITFVRDGQSFKTHTADTLIKDWSLVEERFAGTAYNFHPFEQTTPNGFSNETFFMTLIDGTCYHFDYTTGEIVASGTDRGAKGYWAQEKEGIKRGLQILHTNNKIKQFEEEFEFSGTRATSSCDRPTSSHIELCNEGANWRTVMLLKDSKAPEIVVVHSYIPLTNDHKAILNLTPQDLLAVIDLVKANQQVRAKLQEHEAFGFELFMQGDRFHWNQIALNRALLQSGKAISETDLTDWVGIYVNDDTYRGENEREYLFLNRKTGELLELEDDE
ncbi:hypothetical protein [Sulfuriroseicoccus oceanibius]|uniref:Uncharacterized protein n=1 Tax=Sulfuriroseicoccus oceanibius TaxID=2707525 RepID=A0A6B3L7L2_9BACT|nr:hypothetical protein [Sulfuriroseicoccus oceanibius]QQL44451.1 hypothetical protein G3M56_011225 [Sulfuriroseicoccus oceanibius]